MFSQEQQEVDSLIRGGRFLEARAQFRRSRAGSAPPMECLLSAELSHLTGDNDAAKRMLASVANRVSGDTLLRVKFEEVTGSVFADAGEIARAVACFESALTAAKVGKDLEAVCRIQLRLLPNLAELAPPERLATVADDVRRNVMRLGDSQTLALLHLRFAQLEARRGSTGLASRHLSLGWSALDAKPNIWIGALLSLDASAIRWTVGDFENAEVQARQALALARQAGHVRTQAGAVANLGMFAAHRGQEEEARQLVAEGMHLAVDYPRVRAALLDTAAQLELGAGSLERCAILLGDAQQWCESQDDTHSWLYLSLLQTRARLLQRTSGPEEAGRVVDQAIRLADQKGACLWSSIFRIMRAELLLARNELPAANVALSEARRIGEPIPLSVMAAIERAQARLLAAEGLVPEAASAFGFAVRVSSSVGGGRSQAEVLSIARDSLGPEVNVRRDEEEGDTPTVAGAGTEQSLAALEPRVAAEALIATSRLFAVASRPRLLAREIGILATRLDLEASAEVSVGSPWPRETRNSLSHELSQCQVPLRRLAIICGTEDNTAVSAEVVLGPSPQVESVATALGCLARAAVSLETARREALEKESLWPVDSPDQVGDRLLASPAMRELLDLARRLAGSDIPILLTGETGVGKEVFAREIHSRSSFGTGAFLPYNCAAVPRDMLDAQLFGHKRGAFTGASEGFQGVVRSANGGTLFLDEIGELALDMQPKLLRFLDCHEVHPLGEGRPVKVKVRVIAATNADLDRMVGEGRFREDLYFRLNAMTIRIPPLRDRREEIPALVQQYVERYCRDQQRPTMNVTDEAMEYLVLYSWPGNIRQLAGELRRIVALSENDFTLTPAMLSPAIRAGRRTVDASQQVVHSHELPVSLDQPLEAAVEAIERAMIGRALRACDGNLEKAAERLGISRKGLFLKRKRLGLAGSR